MLTPDERAAAIAALERDQSPADAVQAIRGEAGYEAHVKASKDVAAAIRHLPIIYWGCLGTDEVLRRLRT